MPKLIAAPTVIAAAGSSGGFIIGFIEVAAASKGYGRWSEAIVFSVLILVLVFRPAGLFGQQIGERA